MLKFFKIICFLFIFFPLMCYSKTNSRHAITSSIQVNELVGYENYPAPVKKLISKAADLSKQNLTYQYGSANPKNHGMDCSGTINFLLNNSGMNDVPRSANEMYNWVKKNKTFYAVKNYDANNFAKLKPGDLLFWSGTYKTSNYVTHVMIYLGEDANHKPLMFGSSNGRTYHNKRMWGVSVFDFKLPRKNSAAKFLGYSCIPGLTCEK